MKIHGILLILLAFLGIYRGYANVVEAEGFGFTSLQATNDALRKAIEHCLGREIFSVDKYAVVKEIIIHRRFGMIEDYVVVSEEQKSENHLWEVQLRVQISSDADRKWSQICEILDEKGVPTVMFCIQETLNGKILVPPIGEYQLQQHFEEMGFKVIERQWSEKTRNLHRQQIFHQKVAEELVKAGQNAGADFVIVGVIEGRFVEPEKPATEIYHEYNFLLEIVQNGTGEKVASFAWPFIYIADSTESSRENAGKAGFVEILSPECIQEIAVEIVKSWLGDGMALSQH